MASNWVIEDEAMKVFTAPGKKPGHGAGGDILYKEKKFKNFELSVDWKTSKMGNSGIFYYVREVPGKPIYYAAPEVQVLDNVDATDNKLANHLAGSLYDMLPADPKTVKPAGEWNTIVLLLPNSLLIDLLPLVENLFALGQKPFRHWSKTFSTKGEKVRSGRNSC